MRFRYSYLLIFLFFLNCGYNKGEFGWAVTNDIGKDILEKEFQSITEYKMTRNNLYFSSKDTIHYIYAIEPHILNINPGPNDEYVVVLERESFGFVEIELKKKFVEHSSLGLKDKFIRLPHGKYRVKIGYEGEVIDQIDFTVLPEEGYSYKESDVDGKEEADEIIKYSR